MGYLSRRESAYEHPSAALKSVRSLIVVGASYSPVDGSNQESFGSVSAYAKGKRDYHDVLREKLKLLSEVLHEIHPGCRTRIIIDTAPVLERDFAQRAGLGWFGKNTMLINRQIGSYFFIAAILTDIELAPDPPHESSHCGTCTACLQACPTDAFEKPYVLDARKCISYLTIELRDQPIPEELRMGINDWLFGCDICQEVCPWNRKPWRGEPHPPVFEDLTSQDHLLDAVSLLQMTEQEFEKQFAETPLMRPGRAGMARNAAIVIGNSENPRFTDLLIASLQDESPLVRGACVWALGRIHKSEAISVVESRVQSESDPIVIREIKKLNATQDWKHR